MIVMFSARRMRPGACEQFRSAWDPSEALPPGFQRSTAPGDREVLAQTRIAGPWQADGWRGDSSKQQRADTARRWSCRPEASVRQLAAALLVVHQSGHDTDVTAPGVMQSAGERRRSATAFIS